MKLIGFSTGALARDDFRNALDMLRERNVRAVELSALRQHELIPLIEQLDTLDLQQFEYVSFHAPSYMERDFELTVIEVLGQIAHRKWPIIMHPDAMYNPPKWGVLGDLLCIENMDKRKPIGRTAADLFEVFSALPMASFCFDIGHARQVDPTMSEASVMLQRYRERIRQIHISEVNSQSRHDPLSFESILAFQKVAHLIDEKIPIIVESRVHKDGISTEIENAEKALTPENVLAATGD